MVSNTGGTPGYPMQELSQLSRRVANLVVLGKVEEADYSAARLRVRSGDLLSGWLPWITTRAGGDSTWWAPEVGEQVLLLSPSGDPAQGVVLGAVYQDSHPPPAAAKSVHRTTYDDGTVVEYDRAASRLAVSCVGEITIETGADITVTSAAKITVVSASEVAVTAPIITFN